MLLQISPASKEHAHLQVCQNEREQLTALPAQSHFSYFWEMKMAKYATVKAICSQHVLHLHLAAKTMSVFDSKRC